MAGCRRKPPTTGEARRAADFRRRSDRRHTRLSRRPARMVRLQSPSWNRDAPLAGVLECPARNETYWATSGGGAFKDGVRISVRAPRHRAADRRAEVSMIDALPSEMRRLVMRAQYVPSLAYRIAMVADGDARCDLRQAELAGLGPGRRRSDPARGRRRSAGRVGQGADLCRRHDTVHGSLVAGSGQLLATMAETIRSSG